MSPNLIDLLDRRLSRLRESHGSRLLDEGNAALKAIDIARPASVSVGYEEVLRGTALALKDYCGELRGEFDTFLGSALPSMTAQDRDDVLGLATRQLDAQLYLTRFDKFGEAVEQRFASASRRVDPQAYRTDLLRARQQAGTATTISRFLGALRDDLELRLLATQAVRPSGRDSPSLPPATNPPEGSASSETRATLLLDLFRQAVAPRFAVDRRPFRARHHEHLRTLDDMVTADEIRDKQGFYSAALLALSELSPDPDVRMLLDDCGIVLRVLQDRYLENQADLIGSETLAVRAGLPRSRFDRALIYLHENVSLLGGSQQGNEGPLQMVLPAEKVIELKTVEDVFAELREYRKMRASWAGLPLQSAAAAPDTPAHAVIETRQWLQDLPEDVRALLVETYAAQGIGLRALVLMGVRAAVDMTCNHLVGDLNRFDKKLDALRSEGFISDTQRQALEAVIQLGHASAHRGHIPQIGDVSDVLEILERVLKAHYVDPRTAERLLQATPPRRGPS